MADVSKDKKLKLASTRKRFKELQELKRKKNEEQSQTTEISENLRETTNQETPGDNLEIPVLDSIDNENFQSLELNTVEHENQNRINEGFGNLTVGSHTSSNYNFRDNDKFQENVTSEISPVPNYFGKEQPVAFFDKFSDQNNFTNNSNSLFSNYFSSPNSYEMNTNVNDSVTTATYCDNYNIYQNQQTDPSSQENYELFPKDNNFVKDIQNITNPNQDVICQDDPEIKQNEVNEYQNYNYFVGDTKNNMSYHRQDDIGVKHNPTSDFQNCRLENPIFSDKNKKDLMEYLNGNDTQEKESLAIKQEIVDTSDEVRNEVQHSSVESLRQLSDQMAHMIEPNYEFSASGSITDLEKRNLELAALLEKEKINSEQLKALNQENEKKIAQLETEFREKEANSSIHVAQEITRLKEELQSHIQTIGMLVAEKTELLANISQYELTSKHKAAECEELQARLKASRSRAAELERELINLRSEKSQNENTEQEYSAKLTKLNLNYNMVKEQNEELTQDLLEIKEKLKHRSEEDLRLHQQNQELSGKLSLAEIKIQQLTSGETSQTDSQIEQLTQEKFNLEKQLANLNQMLKTVIKERDESSLQYQQYAQQLNAQIVNLSSKLEQLKQEKESFLIQEQNRIKHIGELERQLQNIQNEQVSFAVRNNVDPELKNEIESCRELCVQLQIEKTSVEENYTKVSNEKDLLMKELEAKNDSISQLESLIEQLRGNQPDSVKLLATMESDKVAAARAVQQNKELKQQLESMQEVFLKLNNDKVELTEKLAIGQHTNKELIEKLQKTELHLQTLADAIEIKDRELSNLRDDSTELNKQVLQQEQLTDRLRHYEAQENSSHALQYELQTAKQMIVKLTNEINQLKLSSNEEVFKGTADIVNELQDKIGTLEIRNEEIEKEIPKNANEEGKYYSDTNQSVLDKDHAMKHLEEKVKKTMQEIADLTEEKQRLEHIVLQLQGETETIGEYVALYQHQRMVLKQKALEKDQQLRQLADDREQIKIKLDKLNSLIKKLVAEKGTVPAELLEHQETMNTHSNNLCEEHSKMNDEINRITINNNVGIGDKNSETAEEIISLLTEIKTSNLVQPDENFHHCPWCSGQLITV